MEHRPDAENQTNATYDRLTGLHDLLSFEFELDHLITKMPGEFSLMYVDLDGFKKINDEQGHAAGDEVLKHTSDLLRNLTRTKPDINDPRRRDVVSIARIGGDEFVLLFPEVNSQETLDIIQNRLQSELHSHGIEASMGGKTHEENESAKDLRNSADKKMLENKNYRDRLRYESLPRRKRIAANLGNRALRYAGVRPPRQ